MFDPDFFVDFDIIGEHEVIDDFRINTDILEILNSYCLIKDLNENCYVLGINYKNDLNFIFDMPLNYLFDLDKKSFFKKIIPFLLISDSLTRKDITSFLNDEAHFALFNELYDFFSKEFHKTRLILLTKRKGD